MLGPLLDNGVRILRIDALKVTKSSEPLCLRVIETEAEFFNLRSQWEELYQRQEDKFLEHSFAWKWVAWQTIVKAKKRTLCIIVGYRDDQLVAVFPLAVQHIGPFRVGHWLGSGSIEYCDILVDKTTDPELWVKGIWKIATSRVHLLRFPFVRPDAKILPHLAQGYGQQLAYTSSPYIDCSHWQNWEAYYASRSKSFKKGYKESLSRLRRGGEPRFALVNRGDRFDETLDWLLARKIEWLEHAGLAAGFLDRQHFYRRVCKEAPAIVDPVLIELVVDNKRVAAQLAFREGRRLHGRIVAQDDDWRASGTGRLIVSETIRWAFQNGIRWVELGAGGEAFKYRFADLELNVTKDLLVATDRLGSGLLFLRRTLKAIRSRLKKADVIPSEKASVNSAAA
jgi:CelD/BcsL family acetyltransferase involved in cellulose biosynthesis